MTTIDTTLYANGALRLADHGPKGGLVLMHVPSTTQLDLPYNDARTGPAVVAMLEREIKAMERCHYEPEVIFNSIAEVYGKPARAPLH